VSRILDVGGSFGVMQGRLSHQGTRGYQGFPWDTWKNEFSLAADRRLEHIEWMLDPVKVMDNPFIAETSELRELTHETGVNVVSLCANFLMDNPFDLGDSYPWKILDALLFPMQEVGVRSLIIPCVDKSSLRAEASYERFVKASCALEKELKETNIRVSLETDLDPVNFSILLDDLDPDFFSVNYDIGNSSFLGYRFEEEFDCYGIRISNIHIKDRLLGSRSVPLGQGNADIIGVLARLKEMKFNGPATMEAFRDDNGLRVLDAQLRWLARAAE